MLPRRKSNFRGAFRLDSNIENLKIGPPAGRRPAGGPTLKLSRLESGRNPALKPDFRRGGTTSQWYLSLSLVSLSIGHGNYNFDFGFGPFWGRFPTELGPEAGSNGSGSANGAERTQN
jgi:hypothetical protein